MENQTPKGKLGCPGPGGHLQESARLAGNLAWMVYNKVPLSSAVSQVVPAATRESLFQLFCDIKANTPKDQKFIMRHAKALKPKTPIGWLALTATLGYCISALLLLSTLTIGISVAGLSIGLMAAMSMGIFLASSLGFLAFLLFASAFAAGAVAFTALSGYVVMSSSITVMKYITSVVFGVQAPASPVRNTQTASSSVVATVEQPPQPQQETDEDVSLASQVQLHAPSLVPEMVDKLILQEGVAEVLSAVQPAGLRPIKTPRKASPCPSTNAGSNQQASSSNSARLATPAPCGDKEAPHCATTSCAGESALSVADSSDMEPNSPKEVISGSTVDVRAAKNHRQKKSSKGLGHAKRRQGSLST